MLDGRRSENCPMASKRTEGGGEEAKEGRGEVCSKLPDLLSCSEGESRVVDTLRNAFSASSLPPSPSVFFFYSSSSSRLSLSRSFARVFRASGKREGRKAPNEEREEDRRGLSYASLAGHLPLLTHLTAYKEA